MDNELLTTARELAREKKWRGTWIEPELLMNILAHAPMRVREHRDKRWGDVRFDLEIRHRGRWWHVGRTDLFDNIATSTVRHKRFSVRAARKACLRAAKSMGCGARLQYGGLSIIDSLTDG